MVGITGSSGKTVVKEWAACSLPSAVRFSGIAHEL